MEIRRLYKEQALKEVSEQPYPHLRDKHQEESPKLNGPIRKSVQLRAARILLRFPGRGISDFVRRIFRGSSNQNPRGKPNRKVLFVRMDIRIQNQPFFWSNALVLRLEFPLRELFSGQCPNL